MNTGLNKKTALLLATGLLAISAAPAMAQDTTGDTRAEAEMLKAQIQALQAQVDSLKNKVDTVDARQTSAAATPASSSSDPKTKIGGTMFFDVTNINQKNDGTKSSANGFQLDVKRFYLTVDHKFDDVFSANLTTDFNYVSNDSETQVYLKKAYLQAKLDDAFVIRAGSADLPWVPFVESLYGYRYVENIMIDRTKYGTSADWGLHVFGKLGGGMFGYAFSAVNGSGYKKLSRSKSVDFEGRINFNPIKQITLAVGGYTGKLGKNIEGVGTEHRARRLDAVAAYTDDSIRFGVEYFNAKNWNNVTTTAEDKSEGWSGFASYQFTDKIGVFGRYDWVKPNKYTNDSLKDDYFNVGVSFKPVKGVDMALVYKRDKAQDDSLGLPVATISTSNGTIGGVHSGTYDEVGLWAQVKF